MARPDFEDGAEGARFPQFESIQQQGIRNYEKLSVLDNLRPSPVGMAQQDYERRLVGVPGSSIGSAQSTFDQRLWMDRRESTVRRNDQEGQ